MSLEIKMKNQVCKLVVHLNMEGGHNIKKEQKKEENRSLINKKGKRHFFWKIIALNDLT